MIYLLYLCKKERSYYGDNDIREKRKNIDLPVDVLQRLSVLAASQGKSLKAFIEHLLVVKANSISVEVLENPSPSGDSFSKMQKIWLRFQHE